MFLTRGYYVTTSVFVGYVTHSPSSYRCFGSADVSAEISRNDTIDTPIRNGFQDWRRKQEICILSYARSQKQRNVSNNIEDSSEIT